MITHVLKNALVWTLALGVVVIVAVCVAWRKAKKIPARFQGEFSFEKSASVAYWNAQPEWPSEVKEQLVRMAIPTILRIDADRIIITDTATGQSVTQIPGILRVGSDTIVLNLHSNFAKTNRATTFQFDADGFWLLEGTLFPNYRERFEKVKNP